MTVSLNYADGEIEVVISKGRRKMNWILETGLYEDVDLAETLQDILSEIDPVETPQAKGFREYTASIEDELAQGAPLVDPRAKEADVAHSATHGRYVQQAITGGRAMKDGNDPAWDQLTMVDFDDPNAKARAVSQAQGAGVTTEGKGDASTGRFGAKDTDYYR